MAPFRRVAAAATAATFLQIAVGGVVRATKSGLGCGTDWPDCGGRLVPAMQSRAQILEFTHRAVAVAVILLVAALLVAAVRSRPRRPRLVSGAAVALGLVLSQAVLGAIVVWLELDAASVVLHLATALALAGLLIYLYAAALGAERRLPQEHDRTAAARARGATGAVAALLLIGSYTSGRDAGLVFPDWPLMDGGLVPDLGNELMAIHFLHRVAAAAVGVWVAVVAAGIIKRRDRLPVAARLAHAALGLFAAEVVIGAANIWTGLNAAVVSLHLAVGAAIFGTLAGVVFVTSPVAADGARARPPGRVRAVAEAERT